MAFLGLLRFSALSLFVLVLAVYTQQAHATSRGFFGKNETIVDINAGLCASSIATLGYKCEEHEIITKDGYILGAQRIPEGLAEGSNKVAKKQPVIVQHGVLVDGASWLVNTPQQNLPMMLADKGYDVWITNSRGTRFSRKHVSKDVASKDYWDWSWDDMVANDLPAMFEYVSNKTGGQKVHYVGHSLGTLVALGFLSEGSKSINLVKSVSLLSPVAHLSHIPSAILQAVANSFVGESLTVLQVAEFNLRIKPAVAELKYICATPGIDCNHLLTEFTGPNCCLPPRVVNILMLTQPQPTATKNMMQLAQNVRNRNGVIAKYDYEIPSLNMKHYGQEVPPRYNFSNVAPHVPLFLSYGGKDVLSDVEDVQILLNDLKSHDKDKLSVQFIENYAHADYMFGVNANEMVYNNVIDFINHNC